MNLNWLNPVNWIKSGVASAADDKIDELLTAERLSEEARKGINYLVQLSKSKVDDDKTRTIANDLVYAGESLKDLGLAIHPDGPEGRELSKEEIAALNARVQVLFGDVVKDWDLLTLRERAKKSIRTYLGI